MKWGGLKKDQTMQHSCLHSSFSAGIRNICSLQFAIGLAVAHKRDLLFENWYLSGQIEKRLKVEQKLNKSRTVLVLVHPPYRLCQNLVTSLHQQNLQYVPFYNFILTLTIALTTTTQQISKKVVTVKPRKHFFLCLHSFHKPNKTHLA